MLCPREGQDSNLLIPGTQPGASATSASDPRKDYAGRPILHRQLTSLVNTCGLAAERDDRPASWEGRESNPRRPKAGGVQPLGAHAPSCPRSSRQSPVPPGYRLRRASRTRTCGLMVPNHPRCLYATARMRPADRNGPFRRDSGQISPFGGFRGRYRHVWGAICAGKGCDLGVCLSRAGEGRPLGCPPTPPPRRRRHSSTLRLHHTCVSVVHTLALGATYTVGRQ